ncbi:MAG TPA: cytochrome P460 family protein [Blastocatellia bacterium]|nr:cytochrome P460 family protein [Blastocatellia bacterium]
MLSDENPGKLLPSAGRRGVRLIVLTVIAVVTCSLYLWAGSDDAVPYPAGYRQWAHVKSGLVGPQNPAYVHSGGIHHIYANDKAMEGYKTGRFPDGSTLVADFLETRESDGITTEGPRRRIDVMIKDGRRYAATGGWGFEQFRGDSQTERMVTAEGATKCFACHAKQKEHDSVFSTLRR